MIYQGRLTTVDNETGLGTLESINDLQTVKRDIFLTQPFVGRGWGILTGIEPDTIVLYDENRYGTTNIISYLPNPKYYRTPIPLDSAPLHGSYFRTVKEGEIAIQSKANSVVFLNEQGNVNIETADGNSIEINKDQDAINQISVNRLVITEGGTVTQGLVKRDIRSQLEKEADLFLSSMVGFDFSRLDTMDVIGVDSKYKTGNTKGALQGVFDPADGTPSILSLPGIKAIPQATSIVSNIKNPALTEYKIEVNEFSDGIAGLNILEQDDASLKQGRLPPNLAGRFTIGTVVDPNGQLPRFDYTFGTGEGKGHGNIWKVIGFNETNNSVDFKRDPKATIKTTSVPGSTSQWIAQGINQFNAALAFQFVLNTRGADHKGKIPDQNNVGSHWSFQVDKEGLTKWNIPAATDIDKVGRKGRSLLWNLDGSITQAVGKEDCYLKKITGDKDAAKFVTGSDVRTGRSWTADFEGNIEQRIGADSFGQSHMVQADGSYFFYYGKTITPLKSIVGKNTPAKLKTPSKSQNLQGASIVGRTEGSIELDIGVNDANYKQSLALNSQGMMRITVGADKANDSVVMQTVGNIRFEVASSGHIFEMLTPSLSAPSPIGALKPLTDGIRLQHGKNKAYFQIDDKGAIAIRNGLLKHGILIGATGAIDIKNPAGVGITISEVEGTIRIGSASAMIIVDPINGITLKTVAGSYILNSLGAHTIACGPVQEFSVNGFNAQFNTSFVGLGSGSKTSANLLAIANMASPDPFTGHYPTSTSALKGP